MRLWTSLQTSAASPLPPLPITTHRARSRYAAPTCWTRMLRVTRTRTEHTHAHAACRATHYILRTAAARLFTRTPSGLLLCVAARGRALPGDAGFAVTFYRTVGCLYPAPASPNRTLPALPPLRYPGTLSSFYNSPVAPHLSRRQRRAHSPTISVRRLQTAPGWRVPTAYYAPLPTRANSRRSATATHLTYLHTLPPLAATGYVPATMTSGSTLTAQPSRGRDAHFL